MAFKKFLLPVVGLALISSVAACSRTSETLETGDIFAPVPTASHSGDWTNSDRPNN